MCSSGSSPGGLRSTASESCSPGTGRPHRPPWQAPRHNQRWKAAPHVNICTPRPANPGRPHRPTPAAPACDETRRTCMDVETAIQAFVSAGHDLPRDTMQWALDHWDEAAPGLLDVLGRYTSGADQSDEAARAVFFILPLAGERHDTRVFPLLCRLAQDGEAIEAVLGDGITTTLKQVLISTYDGDLDALKGVIEAAGQMSSFV